ncbi:MAG: hypothetical protein FWF24_00355 [Alphaproteobacteria bacterium]|nr:hypothetical protein [Alphaproteobacteria bacterium]
MTEKVPLGLWFSGSRILTLPVNTLYAGTADNKPFIACSDRMALATRIDPEARPLTTGCLHIFLQAAHKTLFVQNGNSGLIGFDLDEANKNLTYLAVHHFFFSQAPKGPAYEPWRAIMHTVTSLGGHHIKETPDGFICDVEAKRGLGISVRIPRGAGIHDLSY